ncbi:hypothetical protein NDU88_002237 [Pleurodeles waltl]|uniref:Uncharacterized protein n=1 Tax=Pleurodeles waltl TaxID=8319 RepID=A0AAV7PER4_PLEWA|nr:hypothetical protein NDU88_002237 [Pleurodeles waltl]
MARVFYAALNSGDLCCVLVGLGSTVPAISASPRRLIPRRGCSQPVTPASAILCTCSGPVVHLHDLTRHDVEERVLLRRAHAGLFTPIASVHGLTPTRSRLRSTQLSRRLHDVISTPSSPPRAAAG